MTEPAGNRARYEDLLNLPENLTGEIINGELVVTPRPSRQHGNVASCLGDALGPPLHFGRGDGPGGWIILDEPEMAFGEEILVPGMAGWKGARFPIEKPHNWISAAPDWVCEIHSMSTAQVDRTEKMPLYARHQVSHAWLIDPILKTLEVFRLEQGKRVVLGPWAKSARVHAEPCGSIEGAPPLRA